MIDAVTFIETVLINPETGQPFVLTDAEKIFLRYAFALTPDGRLMYGELVFSGPKKTGKTGFAAMCLLYVIVALGGRMAEAYCAANDFEQSQGRVFQAAARIVEASPLLSGDAVVTQNKITFLATGSTITAIASDYAGAAGANPNITVFDELWGYTSERAHRLWDEMIPPPTRRIACRLTVTYAGFEGEAELLRSIYDRGIAGKQIAPDLYAAGGLLMFWTHSFTAPWQTEDWRAQMREQLRPNAYLRQIENRWVTTEDSFIPIEAWDACVTRPRARSSPSDCLSGSASTPRSNATRRRSCAAPTTARCGRSASSIIGSSSRAGKIHSNLRRRSRRRCSDWQAGSTCARYVMIRTRWPPPRSGYWPRTCLWSSFRRRRAT
jgi:hypothetical protein